MLLQVISPTITRWRFPQRLDSKGTTVPFLQHYGQNESGRFNIEPLEAFPRLK